MVVLSNGFTKSVMSPIQTTTRTVFVFNMFEAKDYRSNLDLTFIQFKEQVDELQSMVWK